MRRKNYWIGTGIEMLWHERLVLKLLALIRPRLRNWRQYACAVCGMPLESHEGHAIIDHQFEAMI